jgi:protease-4
MPPIRCGKPPWTARADDKILVIPITGVITDSPKSRITRSMPGVVQEVVSHLRLAEKDDRIKVVLFKIDTPGGTTTASDILYHEIVSFKARTGKKVVVCMMNLATSGGYYVSLPADVIMAHPTTVTGSVGVILMRPRGVRTHGKNRCGRAGEQIR